MSNSPDEPDLGGVLSAATDYGDARAAEEKAAGDAALAAMRVERDQALADLDRARFEADRWRQTAIQVRAEFDAHMANVHPVTPPPDPDPDPDPDPTPDTGARDLVAVRVFPSYSDKTYGNHPAVLARLADLGVKRISHKFSPSIADSPWVLDFTRRAYLDHGIKSWLTMGEPRVTLSPGEWDKMQTALTGPLAGMVELVSGWNEPNHARGGAPMTADWAERSVAHNREMYTRFKDIIPKIGTPQLWSGSLPTHEADVKKVAAAGIKGTFNTITWHLYPRGTVGEPLLKEFEALYRAQWGPQQVICTEGGYLDAANYTGTAANLTPAEKARLVPLYVDTYVSRGYGISYFELLDDPDSSEANREASLGLVECRGLDPATWTNKPAFDALRDYLAS